MGQQAHGLLLGPPLQPPLHHPCWVGGGHCKHLSSAFLGGAGFRQGGLWQGSLLLLPQQPPQHSCTGKVCMYSYVVCSSIITTASHDRNDRNDSVMFSKMQDALLAQSGLQSVADVVCSRLVTCLAVTIAIMLLACQPSPPHPCLALRPQHFGYK